MKKMNCWEFSFQFNSFKFDNNVKLNQEESMKLKTEQIGLSVRTDGEEGEGESRHKSGRISDSKMVINHAANSAMKTVGVLNCNKNDVLIGKTRSVRYGFKVKKKQFA